MWDKMKYSRQRELVLRTLRENLVHPTADYIYNLLRTEMPNISLGTVYRNLSQLAESGEIVKIPGLDGAVHFDHNTHKHFHFICIKCNKVYDIPTTIAPDLEQKVLEQTGLNVTKSELSLKGICPSCQKYN